MAKAKEMRLHLISNAHLDPIWQWEWEEGCAAAVSTFRCAARFCREFGGYVFCHNESLIYRWVEEYEPTLFHEIQDLVRLGRWHIMAALRSLLSLGSALRHTSHSQPKAGTPPEVPVPNSVTFNISYSPQYFDFLKMVVCLFLDKQLMN